MAVVEKIYEYDDLGEVVITDSGVRCGNHGRGEKIHHANSASVRECYRIDRERIAESNAEIAAEQAYERHLEDKGYWEAKAQDDYEARMGVIQFEDAWDMADPEHAAARRAEAELAY
jgi:hypothetical protein